MFSKEGTMITSFCIEWHSWGLHHCVYDIEKEITKVYRRRKLLTTSQFNAIGNALITASVSLSDKATDKLFSLIESFVSEAANQNYMLPVCDGYHWRLLIRHSDKHVQVIEGTTVTPVAAKELEEVIEELLRVYHYMGDVLLFGAR